MNRLKTGVAMALALRTEKPPERFRKSSPSRFVIGQDEHGHWVAMDFQGREGGFFVSREAALKYVADETGRRRGAALFSSKPLALWK
ncbi:hypothetical protein [Rhodoblastus sp.]|uniref:hypothetical protein n=2 Tax=Rhodoblastus sp. TaxID=1962975 RepID=UPI003F9B3474